MNKFFGIVLVGLMVFGTNAPTNASDSRLPKCKGSNIPIFSAWDNCVGDTNPTGGFPRYQGEFKKFQGEGIAHGNGKKTMKDYVYNGEFYHGNQHGKGDEIRTNGDRFSGLWKDDLFVSGDVIFTYPKKSKYVGEWKNKQRNGQGTYTITNGEKYVGQWKNDDLVEGKHTLKSGVVAYQGQFKDLKYHGKGRLRLELVGYEKGDFFDGSFKNGKIWNGEGRITSKIGEVIEGEFKNSYFANGKYTWPNGDSYVGEMSNKEFHGFGILIFEDSGEKYSGYWKNGHRHGAGTITNKDGSIFKGEFKDNSHWNGTGTIVYRDAKDNITGTYEGQYSNGKQNGRGKYVSDDSVQEGIWKDDVLQTAQKEESNEPKPTVADKKPVQDPSKVVAAATGSGFAVSSDGYVITNHHVINGCQKVFVHTNGKAIPTDLVTYDQQNDLALLKANFKPEAVFPLSNKRPELLQDIYVAGYPFGKKVSSSVKVTKGIISSLTGTNNNFARVQIDAAIQTGNSGGPILDDYGNVVGVAVSKLDVKYAIKNFGSIPENTNFGIKSSVVGSVLDSNGVNSPPANDKPITKSELGKRISKGTYYISCWMTIAQIEKMRTKKVMFSDLD